MSTQNTIEPKPLTGRPTSIRMPDELGAWLREQAAKNHRSYSGEVVHRLEISRQADPQTSTKEEKQ